MISMQSTFFARIDWFAISTTNVHTFHNKVCLYFKKYESRILFRVHVYSSAMRAANLYCSEIHRFMVKFDVLGYMYVYIPYNYILKYVCKLCTLFLQ